MYSWSCGTRVLESPAACCGDIYWFPGSRCRMRIIWLSVIILCFVLTACVASQESSIELLLSQATAAPPEITATQTNVPPSPTETVIHTAAPPTNTPTQATKPPSPTIINPKATSGPVELSHPPLTADSLTPGSHTPYSFLSSSGEEVRYLLFLPEEFDRQAQWPLLLRGR